MTVKQFDIDKITKRVVKKGFYPTDLGFYRKNDKTEEIKSQKCYRRITKLSEFVNNLNDFGLDFTKCNTFLKKVTTSIRNSDAKSKINCEFLKNSQLTEIANPLISSGLTTGSSSHMGNPNANLTPTTSRPVLSNFDGFDSLRSIRSDKDSFLIGFDAEWVGEPRYILSWQFSCVIKDYLYEYIFIRTSDKLLSLDLALSKIFDDMRAKACKGSAYFEACVGFNNVGKPIWRRFESRDELINASDVIHPLFKNGDGILEPTSYVVDDLGDGKYAKADERDWSWARRCFEYDLKYPVTLVCHTGKVDLSTLYVSDDYDNYLRYVSDIQGGAISLNPLTRIVKSRRKCFVGNNYCYPITLNFRDTMGQAPAGKKSLADLGDAINVPKLVDSRIEKDRMDIVLSSSSKLYFEYASRDATVTVLYASALYGYNKEMAVTITSATAKVMRSSMKEYLGISDDDGGVLFNKIYRGVKRVEKGLVKSLVNPGFLQRTNKEPVNEKARDVQMYASEAYHGGLNQSIEIGWYDGLTNDFDLQNAYPTAMVLVPDIDWDDPINNNLEREFITLNHFKDRVGYNPMLPMFGRFTFEFPRNVKYPTVPVNNAGRLVFPRTSKGLDVVYATGPEIFLAIKLGAKVWCERGFILNVLSRKNGEPSYSLSHAVRSLVEDRRDAKKLFGSKSLEELILKTMVNSGYGKNAQNVVDKRTWDAYNQEMTELGDSAITNPVSASLITSYVRALLLATMNEAHEKGYKVYSVTTDGFIADIPDVETLESFDLYGFENLTRLARKFLTSRNDGSFDDSIWEIKHSQNELLNLTTRGNMAPTLGGVCAHNSTKSPFISSSLEDRIWFIQKSLSRETGLVYKDKVWTTFKELSRGSSFKVVDVERSVSMDFDMKRKPIRDSFYTVKPEIDYVVYEIANFDTEPFETIEEARLYESKKRLCDVLRTENHWSIFWNKLISSNTGKQVRKNDGLDWSKLVSCVMGARKGLWSIDELNDVDTTVQEKCDWLNSLELSSKKFKPSDWKNARRPERQVNALPKSDIIDFLERMGAHSFTV